MIHSINAKTCTLLPVLKEEFELGSEQVRKIINDLFGNLLSILDSKGIRYNDLKSALVPNPEKEEVLLVFDTLSIESVWYGNAVFSELLKAFDHKTKNSVLVGDYIDLVHNQALLKTLLEGYVPLPNDSFYSNRFFMVYINNVSLDFLRRLRETANNIQGFVGLVDMTYSSRLKTYLSYVLGSQFVKCGNTIIMGQEDDAPLEADYNMCGYPFEENGFSIKGLPTSLYSLFLSYKIESECDPEDILYSLNSISNETRLLNTMEVLVEEQKLRYLKKEKAGVLQKLNLLEVSKEELAELIKHKIDGNYIYNLDFNGYIAKFNIMFEIPYLSEGKQWRRKTTVSLEFDTENEQLRLITMY